MFMRMSLKLITPDQKYNFQPNLDSFAIKGFEKICPKDFIGRFCESVESSPIKLMTVTNVRSS